jgi:hypothetical protein
VSEARASGLDELVAMVTVAADAYRRPSSEAPAVSSQEVGSPAAAPSPNQVPIWDRDRGSYLLWIPAGGRWLQYSKSSEVWHDIDAPPES